LKIWSRAILFLLSLSNIRNLGIIKLEKGIKARVLNLDKQYNFIMSRIFLI